MGRWERVRGTQTSSGNCTSSGPFEEKRERWREGEEEKEMQGNRERKRKERGDGKVENGERMEKVKERVGNIGKKRQQLTANVRSMNLDKSDGSSTALPSLISSQIYNNIQAHDMKTWRLLVLLYIYLSPRLLQDFPLVARLERLDCV